MVNGFTRLWYGWSLWHLILLPLSAVFGVTVWLRRLGYRLGLLKTLRLPVPVVVVGNIAVGGTGKTPLVLALTQILREAGYRPGIVSRGYGRSGDLPRPVTPQDEARAVGDEPLLLARKSGVPVWVGRDRVAAARALLAAQPQVDVIVSDDGLQHYRLERDVEIAVVDAGRWFGNGQLLPAGPLRESPRRLKQVDAVVINGWEHGAPLKRREFTMQLKGRLLVNLRNPALKAQPEVFAGERVHAVAGIGHPQRFFAHLRRLGLNLVEHPFPDHHAFVPADLAFGSDPIVMTEKDGVKCEDFAGDNVWVLPVQAELHPGFGLAILEKLRSLNGSQAA